MAITPTRISNIYASNTFGDLIRATDNTVSSVNNIAFEDWIKPTGTLILSEPEVGKAGLRSDAIALFKNQTRVEGTGSSLYVQNNAEVAASLYLTNTNTAYPSLYASGNSFINVLSVYSTGEAFSVTGNSTFSSNISVFGTANINYTATETLLVKQDGTIAGNTITNVLQANTRVNTATAIANSVRTFVLSANNSISTNKLIADNIAANTSISTDHLTSDRIRSNSSISSNTITANVLFSNTAISSNTITANVLVSNTAISSNTITSTVLFANNAISTNQLTTSTLRANTSVISNTITANVLFSNTAISTNTLTSNVLVSNTAISSNTITSTVLFANNAISTDHLTSSRVRANSAISSNTITANVLFSNTAVSTDQLTASSVRANSSVSSNTITANVLFSNTAISTNTLTSDVLVSNTAISTNTLTSNVLVSNTFIKTNILSSNTAISSNTITANVLFSNTAISTNTLTSTVIVANTAISTNTLTSAVLVSNTAISTDQFTASSVRANSSISSNTITANVLFSNTAISTNTLTSAVIVANTAISTDRLTSSTLRANTSVISNTVTANVLFSNTAISSNTITANVLFSNTAISTNTLTSAVIVANTAISTDQFTASSVRANSSVSSNTITANVLFSNTAISSNTISSSVLFANTAISSNTISSSVLFANNAISTDHLTSSRVRANSAISSNTITANVLFSNTAISTNTLTSTVIVANTAISTNQLTSSNIQANSSVNTNILSARTANITSILLDNIYANAATFMNLTAAGMNIIGTVNYNNQSIKLSANTPVWNTSISSLNTEIIVNRKIDSQANAQVNQYNIDTYEDAAISWNETEKRWKIVDVVNSQPANTTPISYVNISVSSDKLSSFASTTSAELASIITDETGTGSLVFSTNPVLVAPNIGNATASNLSVSTRIISNTIHANGYNSIGGVGSHTFLTATNLYGSATNPAKHFRLTGTGDFEIINNSDTSTLFRITDSGNINSAGTLTSTRLLSSVANGTAPLAVNSSTLVANLNSSLLSGQPGSFYTNISNLGYDKANAANTIASSAYDHSNSAYRSANSAYTHSNSSYESANSAYRSANSAYFHANSVYTHANSAFAKANAANTIASSAYDHSNSAYRSANSAYFHANSAFEKANLAAVNLTNANNITSGYVKISNGGTNNISYTPNTILYYDGVRFASKSIIDNSTLDITNDAAITVAGTNKSYDVWSGPLEIREVNRVGNFTSTSSSISGTTLTIGGSIGGVVGIGVEITGSGVTPGTIITGYISGSGGAGSYTVSPSQSVSATAINASSNTKSSPAITFHWGNLVAAAIKMNPNGHFEFRGQDGLETGNEYRNSVAYLFDSKAANGTPPLAVNSSTLVSNLNSSLFNSQPASYYLNASNMTSGTLAVARGGTGVTTSTGTGNVVLSNSPTLVTPILGTPQSGNFSTGTFTWPTFNQSTTGNAATASSAQGSGFYTSGSGGENQIGTFLSGYNSAYLYNNASAWGLYSASGGAIIQYNRSSGTVTTAALTNTQTSSLGVGVAASGTAGQIKATGEIISTTSGGNQARFIGGNYGVIHRNDGSNYYILLTNSADQYGNWNSYRPFTVDTTNSLVILNNTLYSTAAGNVGIGISSPSDILHIRKDSVGDIGVVLQNRSSSGSPEIGVKFITGTLDLSDNRYAEISSIGGSSTSLIFRTSNGLAPAEVMRITPAGNIGIGTNSPSYKLDVSGDIRVGSSSLLILPTAAGTNQIGPGTGDGASYTTYNMYIRSWYGLAFQDYSGAVNAVLDCRTGNFSSKGQFISTVATGTAPLAVSSTTVVSNLNADLLDGQQGSYYAPNSSLGNYLPLAGGTLSGRVIQSTSGFGAATKDDITTRTDSGFFQTGTATTAEGWPETTNSFYHLLSSTHDNLANYYSMQFASSFYDSNKLYYRSTNGSGTTAWNKVWHSGNDGVGSTLDADLLDGQQGSYYAPNSSLANYLLLTGGTLSGTLNAPYVLIDSTNQYSGQSIRTTYGSASLISYSFIDFKNELNIPTGAIFNVHETNGGSILSFYTTASGSRSLDRRSEAMRINSSGNIGIGTSSPGQKLDVSGSIRSSNQLISTVATGTAPLEVSSSTLVSNLNADLLDGINGASFLRSDTSTTYSGGLLRVTTPAGSLGSNTGEVNTLQVVQTTGGTDAFMSFHIYADFATHFGIDSTTNDLFVGGWNWGANKYKIWHAGNDGAGSTLDADLLDGQDGSYYLNASNMASGTLAVARGGTGVTTSTGTGSVVLNNSPTLVTPILGTPQSGNFSTGTFTWPTFNQNTTGTAAGLSATLVATSGGTGQSSYVVGDILYASTTSALSRLADVATGNALISGGVGVAPSWGKVGLTTHVSGTLAAGNGGTGQSSYVVGDILYASTTTALSRLADIAAGNVLISGGVGVAPSWGKVGLTTHVSGTLAAGNGGTGLTTFTSGGAVFATSTSTLTTGILPPASGGTGLTSFNSGGAVYATNASTLTTGTLPVASGGTGVTTSTGTGSVVLNNSPTLVTPILGTPQSGNFSTGTFTWPTFNQNTTGTSSNITAYTINQNVGSSNNVQFNSLGIGTAASATAGEIRATNQITAYYSDERLKTNLGGIENALDKVNSLSGFYYQANETAQELGYSVEREVGVSAQEVQKVLPEIVVPAPIDEKYLTVRYERLVPLLIEAIKELSKEVNDLKSRLGE